MRITNNMIKNNYMSALNGAMERQSSLQQKLADGKAIHRPSDDPIKTIRSLKFNTNVAVNEQYTQNVNDSISWMENTDGAMSDLSSIMIRAKELAVSADGTKPPDALNAIGAEIDQLINQAVAIGNTKIGDRYIFAGQMDKTEPLTRTTVTDPASGKVSEVVLYNGDLNKISIQIKPGTINPADDGISLTGVDVFGPLKTVAGNNNTLDIFNKLLAIKQELQRSSPQMTATAGAAGNATVGGVYTGTGYTNFDVRIDTVAAGQVNTASYSTDGGATWITPAPIVPGNPSTVTLSNGVTLDIATNAGNAPNGTYSFHVPVASGSTPDVVWLSNVGIADIDAAHSAQLKQQTEMGAKMSTYEMAKNMLEDSYTTIMSDLSLNEDLDVPAAIIDFKTSENVYNSALSIGAKLMPMSLLDFLR